MSKRSFDSLFSLKDFRIYVRAWALSKGRGEYRRISQFLGMHTTLVSQILNGKKCFTEEQASKLCAYMALSLLETDYFLKLVLLERAGSEQLRVIYERHLKQIRSQANEVRSRVPETKELSHQDRAIFYSSWQYGLIRLFTSIPRLQSLEEISRTLELPVSRVQEVLEFLTSRGLCSYEHGKYYRTDQNTHVEARSPLSVRHHQNWRAKSIELHEKIRSEDLAFTAPISLSAKDMKKVRAILLNSISEISKVVENSPSEEVSYLGIDWIKLQ